MFDILNSAIKRNKPHLIKKLIEDIDKDFDKINDPLGHTLTRPIIYYQTYLEIYHKFLACIYNNKDPLEYIRKLIKKNDINETLIYVCVIFNIYVKELLELDNFWIDDNFIKKIIRNNTPNDIFILKYILKRYNHEDLICFYKAYYDITVDDIIVLFINSPECNNFDDFCDFYNQFNDTQDSSIYKRLQTTKSTPIEKRELNNNIREWLYLHKLSYYEKFIMILFI